MPKAALRSNRVKIANSKTKAVLRTQDHFRVGGRCRAATHRRAAARYRALIDSPDGWMDKLEKFAREVAETA